MSSKRKAGEGGSKKRVKLDQDEEVVWGEVGSAEEEERRTFLYSVPTQANIVPAKQMLIKLLSGQEWLCSNILKEILGDAVDMVELVSGVGEWEEWEDDPVERMSKMSQNKESGGYWRSVMLGKPEIKE